MVSGYSKINHDEYETCFANQWMDLHGESHPKLVELCMDTFEYEYVHIWTDLIVKLESWIVTHDAYLESIKGDPPPA